MLTLTLLLILGQTPREVAVPVPDPGWPTNAAQIFNHPGRIAWRNLAGRWTSDHPGKVPAGVLADFRKLDALKRIVVHEAHATLGWSFTAWQVDVWDRAPGQAVNPVPFGETTVQLDLYGEGPVPEGVEVVDRRMHGHPPGNVIEGRLTDPAGGPVVGRVMLQDVASCRTGPETVAEAAGDASGRWVLRHPAPSYYRLVAEAEGFVPRVIGSITLDSGPQWRFFEAVVARPVTVTGRVVDDAGRPLNGVQVNFDGLVLDSGGRYESPGGVLPTTDEEGLFSAQVPAGKATLWPYASGWCRPGPGLPISTPSTGVELRMIRTAEVRVTVDFPAGPVDRYRVSIEPEGEKVVGMLDQWRHFSRNPVRFVGVQPGRYVIRGRPDPGGRDDESASVTIQVESGKASEVTLRVR